MGGNWLVGSVCIAGSKSMNFLILFMHKLMYKLEFVPSSQWRKASLDNLKGAHIKCPVMFLFTVDLIKEHSSWCSLILKRERERKKGSTCFDVLMVYQTHMNDHFRLKR